jgi:hypothetical protein
VAFAIIRLLMFEWGALAQQLRWVCANAQEGKAAPLQSESQADSA